MKKVNDSQADGKLERQPVTSLDELFGFSKATFNTHDFDDYHKQLRQMTIADLQNECLKQGLAYRSEREIMIERLEKKFKQYTAGVLQAGKLKPTIIRSKKAARIMKDIEGRKV